MDLLLFSLTVTGFLFCHVAAYNKPFPQFLANSIAAMGGDARAQGEQDLGIVRRELKDLVPAQALGGTRTKLHLVGDPKEDYGHWAGYMTLRNKRASRLFYMYFQSRNGPNNTDPLVLWLNGGPGCSSLFGLFDENGPYVINNDNKTLSWREYGWDKVSNIIFLDQPVGTGFSYTPDVRDYVTEMSGYAEGTYDFLQQFLATFPEVAKRPFFITGESYAGKYIPLIAQRIVKGNRKRAGLRINLKGMAIGNPYTEPYNIYKSYPEFVYYEKKMTKANYRSLTKEFDVTCGPALKFCAETRGGVCKVAAAACNSFFGKVLSVTGSGNPNYYDIRQDCVFPSQGCYDSSYIDKFLALPNVKKALGIPTEVSWEGCSDLVYYGVFSDDAMDIKNILPGIFKAGVKTLIYSGDKDIICNWISSKWMLRDLKWIGQAAFNSAQQVLFKSDKGISWGEYHSAGVLTHLKVYNAGHMVPSDQPEAAFEMFRRFIGGETL